MNLLGLESRMNRPIAIIPARGGSKRIPKKNIREFAGKPAISYAIEAAINATIFSEIIVSTDDQEIAEISKKFGASIIISRPQSLADDVTPTVPVIAHAIESYLDVNKIENLEVCCIYPINPFIESSDLIEGLELLRLSPQTSYVLPICSYPYPIQRSVTFRNSQINMRYPDNALVRSQDLEESFHDAGQWYWGRAETWIAQEKLLFNSKGIRILRWRCQDIDTEEDWKSAELLFDAYQKYTQK